MKVSNSAPLTIPAARAVARRARPARPPSTSRANQTPGRLAGRTSTALRRATSGPSRTRGLPNLSRHEGIIQEAARRYGLDPNLIRGVIAQESRGVPHATSRAGARGLMQLMPATARSLGVSNPLDPRQNILGGSAYLARQLRANGGNVERALWAYNAGPGNLARGRMPRETRAYIPAVLNYANQYRRAQ